MTGNVDELLKMEPLELCEYLDKTYPVDVPEEITTVPEMERASRLLLKLSSESSYLNYLKTVAEICTRRLKAEKGAKDPEALLMQDRKKAITAMTKIIGGQYAAISRAITVKQENNKEIFMSH